MQGLKGPLVFKIEHTITPILNIDFVEPKSRPCQISYVALRALPKMM